MNLEISEFIKYRKEFSLGFLTTESFHPLSQNLSIDAQNNLGIALETLQNIDRQALQKLKTYSQNIFNLQRKCQKTILNKSKVFLSGCGATGRLALSMEKLYREKFQTDQVIGFMAGGDMALIKSVERFEDNFDYGHRQLKELGFCDGDLLLAITEGGETSFVIGTAEFAAIHSMVKPTFVYCNPDEELSKISRSQKVLNNEAIEKLNLTIGPMAISGSTRMQATTTQMIAVGFALLYNHPSQEDFNQEFFAFIDHLLELDYSKLEKYILSESAIYQAGGILHYQSNEHIALAILTDTTERSPTFNLKAFETKDDPDYSLCYLSVGKGDDDARAWEELLGRSPRALDWQELAGMVNLDKVHQFDISQAARYRRQKLNSNIHDFEILDENNSLVFHLGEHKDKFELANSELFYKHLALKLLLNTHSTLVMGRLGRYIGNMMSYVRASNMKLIDRAIRYIEKLLEQKGIQVPDQRVAEVVFQNLQLHQEPIVLRVFHLLEREFSSEN